MQRPASIDLGPYHLGERIGEGGSGQVFAARGPSGPVAVKLLGPASDLDDASRARFAREIAALAQLSHPGLVRLLDHGIDAELGPYLVLPLLSGPSLRALAGGRALSPEAAILLVQPIAEAVAALHAAGYIHRDLKPENAIAAADGAITVIDLGLAWRDGMTRHTETGTAVGSIGYMAPEQIDGRAVDARADVWALGVMIYELIAGQRPFARARPSEEAAATLLGACARLGAADRRCDERLTELVARCLAAEPARRPAASELAGELAAMIDWTDDPATERAAVVADPVGYQQRIAAFRVRRLERLAEEALAAGRPFAALACCDRGLAYAPEHPGLLALVARAEQATPTAASAPPPATAAPTAPVAPPRRRGSGRWWLALAALGIVVGGLVAYAVTPSHAPDPWAAGAPARAHAASQVEAGIGVMRDFVSVFSRAVAVSQQTPGGSAAAAAGSDDLSWLFGRAVTGGSGPAATRPTTATGWFQLAATQSPRDAIASLRHALQLAPAWPKAQAALCAALAAVHDPGALGACEIAVGQTPNDATLRAARGSARLDAGELAGALSDLDAVVAADPDPRWRRLRARARAAAGDARGARDDLAQACRLGDAGACAASP